MAEDEHYTNVDISDMIDDSDQYLNDSEYQNTEFPSTELSEASEKFLLAQDSEILNSEDQVLTEKKPPITSNKSEVIRSTRLPMARIKNIMKMDPDVNVISGDAVFLVTKAAEMFLETLVKETYSYTMTNKRKTINKKDLDLIINKVDCLCFLEGGLDF
ncbi:unnamed protein product [Diatraea saccharalis]|uniref:Transcription factor CBF/NF-Y/archaeal histone domain-containing protein n=1 Tax=Diatraea saccharalis TaxID=40085 RepID=A0A9N9QWL7_9NEOP|nr:unnamed protein product [Diatraea saccharalis]